MRTGAKKLAGGVIRQNCGRLPHGSASVVTHTLLSSWYPAAPKHQLTYGGYRFGDALARQAGFHSIEYTLCYT
jgi:hypothetical protein